MQVRMTNHANKVMVEKGFSIDTVRAVLTKPERTYPNGRYPGQYRMTGNGLCLVVEPRNGVLDIITMYADQVLTPPRPDQLDTPHGREYAARYAAGLGRTGKMKGQ